MKKVVLLGDSITEYMPYEIDKEMKRGFNVAMSSSKLPNNDITFYICGVSNIGVGTYHNYGWKNVIKDDIDCFVLLIGINNLFRPDCDYDGKESLDDTFEKMKAFIQDIISSGKDLIVELLYPTDSISINKKVITINEKLRVYCEQNSIDYLDLYEVLLGDDGLINCSYTGDGLHPNKVGYIVIIDHISKKIESKYDQSKSLYK